ncbi:MULTISPECIES: phosphoribosyltransferase family protein [unclassified Modicisalibacter]|uniref:phosphoribosyltransferase n=1 Tax=unclassified Modicisalibacter TaxID=2679913 RepID=UPI001CC8F2D1|nr:MULTISPECIES: phosphoribosyltransferase family protein [unclassified Modicisalibacter]MBZ9559853.1 phosphoribosyltransferase [Modicisalibacter sp. R2A 31.J]MBZ9577305.1 phosphoribosyltransferase [Modicisalibacter sp. MOD 31.J]
MNDLPLRDRRDAGERLAKRLRGSVDASALVLGLPRGGVPVAAEIARALGAELDVMVVRKLGVPGHEEFAMGAIASGGVQVLDEPLIHRLGLDDRALHTVVAREQRELERRERVFRGERPYPSLAGRQVILVDDGIATGATMRAAIRAVRRLGAEHCILAVPVAAPDSLEALRPEVDRVECLAAPADFSAVGQWYRHFDQTGDDEVRACLREQGESQPPQA